MRKFIEHMKQRPPHERRLVAMRIAAGVTGVIFVGWMATLGVRLAAPSPKVAQQNSFENQVASVFSSFTGGTSQQNTLEVASSSENQ